MLYYKITKINCIIYDDIIINIQQEKDDSFVAFIPYSYNTKIKYVLKICKLIPKYKLN